MSEFENPHSGPITPPKETLSSVEEVKEKVQEGFEQGKHEAKVAADKIYNVYNQAPPEIKAATEMGKSFYQENKKVINTVVIGAIVLRIYKKKVAKTTAKAVLSALTKDGGSFVERQNYPTLFEIWQDLKANPDLAYIPHGGGMVHLLAPSKDIIVTIFGNFENMNTEQIFSYAGRALGMRGY